MGFWYFHKQREEPKGSFFSFFFFFRVAVFVVVVIAVLAPSKDLNRRYQIPKTAFSESYYNLSLTLSLSLSLCGFLLSIRESYQYCLCYVLRVQLTSCDNLCSDKGIALIFGPPNQVNNTKKTMTHKVKLFQLKKKKHFNIIMLKYDMIELLYFIRFKD